MKKRKYKYYFLEKNMSRKWKNATQILWDLSSDIYNYIFEGKFLVKKKTNFWILSWN
jgi:hypothetical protein